LALTPLADTSTSDAPCFSVLAGSESFPQTPGSASFGVWKRNAKKQLPARVRHEVASQRQMAELLEKIILQAHFQDAGSLKTEKKERQLKPPHREPWPSAEDLNNQAVETQRSAIDLLLEQSQLYGESVQEAAQTIKRTGNEEDASAISAGASKQRPGLSRPTTADEHSETSSNHGSVPRRLLPEREEASRSSSRSTSKRVPSKKPGVPRTQSKKKPFTGWSHLRLAATALQPFGGLGGALKKVSGKDKDDHQDEDGSKHEDEQEEGKAEEASEAAQNPTPIKATMFDTCFALSKQYFVPIDEVKKCLEEFKQIDTSGDMLISEAEFEASTRQNLNWPEDQDLPANLARKIKKYFQDMDKDRNDVIDFEEYFDWSMKHRWSEEFLALDDKDMENRQLARQLGVSIAEVERYRRMFDEFDTDGSDEISQSEFVYVIMQIMEVKDPRDISSQRLHRYWQEVDTDASGNVSFQEFLSWMLTKGPEHVKRVW